MTMQLRIAAIIYTLTVASTAGAAEDKGADSTQALTSPLGVGTGATLSAGKGKAGINAGITHQFGDRGGYFQAGLEGKVQSGDTFTAYSSVDGIGNGLGVKVGLGWSSRANQRHREYEKSCTRLRDQVAKDLTAQAAAERVKADRTASESRERACKQAVIDVLHAARRTTDPASRQREEDEIGFAKMTCAELGRAVEVRLGMTEPLQTLALKMAASERLNGIATEAETKPIASSPDVKEQSIPTCGSIIHDPKGLSPEARRLMVDHVDSEPRGLFRISLNVLTNFNSFKYHPAEGTAYDLAQTKSAVKSLPGLSIDAAWISGRTAVGLQVGGQRTVGQNPVNVCKTTTDGAYSYEECAASLLGPPKPEVGGFAAVAFALLPDATTTAKIGPGFQVNFRVDTAAGTDSDGRAFRAFSSESFRYRIGLPLFLATANNPWQLRVGVAPEVAGPFGTNNPEFRVLLFSGLSFPGVTR